MELFRDFEKFGAVSETPGYGGSKTFAVKDAPFEAFALLQKNAAQAGYCAKGVENKGDAVFETFEKGPLSAFASYSKNGRRLAVTLRENAYKAPEKTECEKFCPPLLTQLRMGNWNFDCGMGYVIRTSDGNFVIIDGGAGKFEYSEETEHLIETVEKQNVKGGKPVVSAWFLTHAHNDHFGVIAEFAEKYADRLDVRSFVLDLPDPDHSQNLGGTDSADIVENAISSLGTKMTVPSSGQTLIYGDAEFEVLLTPEDFYPDFIEYFNNTSVVTRMKLGKHTVLWLGDACRVGGDKLVFIYGKEYLKTEIMQVGHHGFNGGSDALHDAVKPEYLLWPASDFAYTNVRGSERNAPLEKAVKKEKNFVSGKKEITLDLNKDIPAFRPYPEVRPGDVAVDTSFEEKRLIDLPFCCPSGSKYPFTPPLPELKKGRLSLRTRKRRPASLELLQTGRTEDLTSFRLTLECRGGLFGKTGLSYAPDKPDVYDKNKILYLPSRLSRSVFVFENDFKTNKGILYKNGKKIKELPYVRPHGLYLILSRTKFTLYSVRIEAL